MSASSCDKRVYDHRLRDYVRETRDVSFAVSLGVPKTTISGWLKATPRDVVSHEVFDLNDLQVRRRIFKLELQLKIVKAIMRLLLAVFRVFRFQLNYERLPEGKNKKKLLRAIERARKVLPLRAVLRILKLSSTRFHSWTRAEANGCSLDDQSTCPISHPTQLTQDEVRTMHDIAIAPEYRHVSTGRLAILAQRLGMLFASPSTWQHYVRTREWRRPRKRIHPTKPTVGLRCDSPDATWHIDTTVIRLLDGTKAYLQAIIDNYSRRVLVWRLGPKLESAATATLLVRAYESRESSSNITEPQSVMVDGGVENFNEAVMKLVNGGLLKLILAQTDLCYSNSMIEAFWRVLKHQWLFLNQLDSITTLRRFVEFYVNQHNSVLPHSAFRGQTPDEMYFHTGDDIPEQLEAARLKARQARMEENRRLNCETCQEDRAMVVNE
jgi:transposase InsO family protein